jgi:hypothetical protein
MSDFLSNLVARSFTDAPVIRPRVPSLFEPTADEFFEDRQSCTPTAITPANAPAPVPKSSLPARETPATKSMEDESEAPAEEHLPEAGEPPHQNAPVIAQTPRPGARAAMVRKLELETNEIIVPAGSFRDGEKIAGNKQRVSQAYSEPRPVRPRHRKDFSPVEQQRSTSAPIIRVTIGRVDVRAVHPPAATPKQAKPVPPKVSLEDYLHKQERGTQ